MNNLDQTAKRHAHYLLQLLGRKKALAAVERKIEDAPFSIGQDRNWWLAVKQFLAKTLALTGCDRNAPA